MSTTRALLAHTSLVALFSLASCSHPDSGGDQGTAGTNGSGTAGTNGSGTAGTNGAGTAGTNGAGTAGTTGAGTAGTTASGTAGRGGTTGTAGTSATGTAGTSASGTAGRGGTTGTAGTSATGTAGTTGTAGNTGTGGAMVDMGGVPLAKPGDMTSQSGKYLNLGDMRLINNRWGSDALNCSGTQQSVCVTSTKTLGWTFNRGGCGETNHSDPDFPEIEFGVAPFGMTSPLLTTPNFSSTTLLPIQISAINSASVTLSSFDLSFTSATYWDANFEFWISKEDPTKNPDAGVYAEVIIFLGWETNRQNGATGAGGWACSVPGSSGPVSAGESLTLCHQRDDWGGSNNTYWRFFNFVVGNGSDSNSSMAIGNSGSGQTFDIKAILSWIMSNYQNPTTTGLDPAKGNATAQFSSSMWLTRIEVGTEIDDSTAGQAKIGSSTGNVIFEINGTTRSPVFGQ